MALMAYDGLRTSGTFRVNPTTKGLIAKDPKSMIGKAVAFTVTARQTGDPEVGYGSDGAAIAGIVTAVEQDQTASEEFVATVTWSSTFDNVATDSSTSTAKEGVGIVCDGKGGVKTSPTAYNAFCLALHSGKKACLIRVL